MSTRPRLALWGAASMGGVLVLAVVGVVLTLNARLERVDVDGLGPGPDVATVQSASNDGEPLTVLVLGSDSRAVLTPDERRELGTGDAEGERMETIVLVRLDPGADQPRMLSIPRDSLVTRCDGSRGRVNAAYGIGERDLAGGGLSCVVSTLRAWLGVRIDHVVKADFRGFVDVVDAIGGVRMWIEEPLEDRRANLDLPAGCATLDGAEALAFVRARSLDDDFGRMARQQRFVEELRREIAELGILDDLPRLLRTADAVAQAVQLDSTLSLSRLQQLVREHRSSVSGPIDGRVLTGEFATEGPAFLDVDQERARELVVWLVEGRDPADDRPTPVPGDGDGGVDATDAPRGPAAEEVAGMRRASEVPVVDRCR